jgi:hypothetical protein
MPTDFHSVDWLQVMTDVVHFYKTQNILLNSRHIGELLEYLSENDFDQCVDQLNCQSQLIYEDGKKDSYLQLVRNKGYISLSEYNMMINLQNNAHKIISSG